MFGWVEVFVGSRGELVRSGVFLYTSAELQHTSSSEGVTSVGRLQHHLTLERPHQHSSTADMTIHHDSYTPLATPAVRSSRSERMQLGHCAVCLFMSLNPVTCLWVSLTITPLFWRNRSCPRLA